MKITKITSISGAVAAAALALSGCGASNTSSGGSSGGAAENQEWADCVPGTDAKDTSSMGEDKKKEIKIAAFNGWAESEAISELVKWDLEKKGYTVTIDSFDAAPAYTGVAKGDYDFLVDAWLPKTHADYIKKYGDKLDPHGCWYNNAKLTIAVNKDSKAQSIGDLKTMGKEYGNTLYGIEAGAGLTAAAKEAVKDYDLSNIDFKISSTPAMLAQLQKSIKAQQDVAVTLWRPHWAYDEFEIRDLKDPKGVMGKAEVIYNFSNKEFTKSNPMVSQLLQNLVVTDDQLANLENEIQKAGDGKAAEAVKGWAEKNQDFINKWEKGELKGEKNADQK